MPIDLRIRVKDDGTAVVEKFTRNVKKKGREAEKSFTGSLTKMQQSVKGFGGILTAVAGGVVISSVKNVLELASAAEEVGSKFDVVFKELKEGANKEFEALAEQIGRSETELKKFGSLLGDIIKPLGFSSREAFTLSKRMTQLALDVASFNNAQDADVVRAFAAALTGERESLKTYGIVINEADVATEAYTSGLAKQGEALSKVEKAQATVNLLYANSADAQGDLARTSDSFANTLKTFSANVATLGKNIGEILLPAATRMIATLNEIGKHQEIALVGRDAQETADFINDVVLAINDSTAATGELGIKMFELREVNPMDLLSVAAADASQTLASAASSAEVLKNELQGVADATVGKAPLDPRAMQETVNLVHAGLAAQRQWVNLVEQQFGKTQGLQVSLTDMATRSMPQLVNQAQDYDAATRSAAAGLGQISEIILTEMILQTRELADLFNQITRLLVSIGVRLFLGSLGIPGFQHGGSFKVGGSGGPDSQLVAFRATPGERVDITPPGRQINHNTSTTVGTVIINSQLSEKALRRSVIPMLTSLSRSGKVELRDSSQRSIRA